jgi:hypothetical protein
MTIPPTSDLNLWDNPLDFSEDDDVTRRTFPGGVRQSFEGARAAADRLRRQPGSGHEIGLCRDRSGLLNLTR